MKRSITLLLFLLTGLFIVMSHGAVSQRKMKKEAVLWPAQNITWDEMKGAAPGVMTALLWGDRAKGPYGAFVKFPANTKQPLHTHSNDIKAIIVSGTFTYGVEGEEEKPYGPGSYLLIPANVKHSNGSGAEGVMFFMEQSGKFDMKVVETDKK